MINTARALSGVPLMPIRFEVATAEDLGSRLSEPIADSAVDLITAATAAHWFDMARFWHRASQVLKPGGTIAIWTSIPPSARRSMPNAEAITAVFRRLGDEIRPYIAPGNILARDLYQDLSLPWDLEPPVVCFDQRTFVRTEWSPGQEADEFFAPQPTVDLDTLEKTIATHSPIIRWYEAHPADVGTERDIVKIMRRDVEKILHEAGVEPGKEVVRGGAGGVLLLIKKKA